MLINDVIELKPNSILCFYNVGLDRRNSGLTKEKKCNSWSSYYLFTEFSE